MSLEIFLATLAGVVIGACIMAATILYMQRRNIVMPSPAQAAEIVNYIIWAINAAQVIYGKSGAERATEAETLASKALSDAGIVFPAPLLQLAIRLLYHAVKPDLPPPAGNQVD